MNIIYLNTPPRGANLFHLVHSMRRHPDMKRQRSRRQRSKDLQTGRRLKTETMGWLPDLPETYVWEKWFQARGWTYAEAYRGRRYDEH